MTTARSLTTVERDDTEKADERIDKVHELADDGDGLAGAARRAADSAAGAAGELAARVPEAADTARAALGDADRFLRSRSEHDLTLMGMLTTGIAAGLLMAGAPRVLVIASLVPGAAIAATLAGRREGALG